MKAMNIAAYAHKNQTRKCTEVPYIAHPFAVMTMIKEHVDDDDVLIAALFHDILEDCPERYSASQMRADFGDRVVELVKEVTKIDSPSWQERSDAYLAHLRDGASETAVVIAVADKTHNLMSTLADFEEQGDGLWERFNAGKERQQWWYRSVFEAADSRLPGHPLVEQLRPLVARLQDL